MSASLGKGPENAQTSVSHLVEIWSKVDVKMGLEPNLLEDGERVDDLWFHNSFIIMKAQLELPEERRLKKYDKAATIRTKLNNLGRFVNFIKTRSIYAGIHCL